ncbi:hypothetical protein LIA77_10784 [Sarocladium implicatum]|nr:hypothetical protein LIA77_10784 [Sarocladium implicatum]
MKVYLSMLSLILSALSATALAAPLDIASDVALIPRAAEAAAISAPKSLLARGLSMLGFSPASHTKKDVIEKRVYDVPEHFIVTDEDYRRVRVYTREEIERAVAEGFRRHQAEQFTAPWGESGTRYPHRYYDDDIRVRTLPNIPSNGPYWEFPIFHNRNNGTPNLYASGNPRRDRVVFDGNGNFITVIAHAESQGDNSFYPGHAVIYTLDGQHFQLADENAFSGSNPDYNGHWENNILKVFIQNFQKRF